MTKNKVFVLCIIAAALLRVAYLWRAPLWYDENCTLAFTRLPLEKTLLATANDTHPPLWYLVEWPISQMDLPGWTLRIPSVLCSLLAIWIFWKILQELEQSAAVRWVALILMIVMPTQIYYAQEARMYTLLELEVLLGFYALLKRRYSWLTLACAAACYTQNYGLFYTAALALAGLVLHRQDWRKLLLSAGLTGLAWLPWSLVVYSQMTKIASNYWIFDASLGGLVYTIYRTLFLSQANALKDIPSILVIFGWLALGVYYSIRHRRAGLAPLLIMAFFPLALAQIVSLLWQPIILFRPLLPITPFLYIFMARPVEQLFLGNRFRFAYALYATVFILPVLLSRNLSYYLNLEQDKDSDNNTAGLVYILERWKDGDIIYHSSDSSWMNMAIARPDLAQYKNPACDLVPGSLSEKTRETIGMQIVPFEDLSYRRAWVIWIDSPLTPQCMSDEGRVILGQAQPEFVMVDNQYVYAAIWLIEKGE